MTQQDIFKLAATILQHAGVLSANNPLMLQSEFSDDRIEIVASISRDEAQITALFINLNLPFEGDFVSGVDESTTPFAIPRPRTYETPVFQWAAGETVFHRPGLWETYLAVVVKQIQSRVEALQMLNGIAIDDGALFDDVPLGAG